MAALLDLQHIGVKSILVRRCGDECAPWIWRRRGFTNEMRWLGFQQAVFRTETNDLCYGTTPMVVKDLRYTEVKATVGLEHTDHLKIEDNITLSYRESKTKISKNKRLYSDEKSVMERRHGGRASSMSHLLFLKYLCFAFRII